MQAHVMALTDSAYSVEGAFVSNSTKSAVHRHMHDDEDLSPDLAYNNVKSSEADCSGVAKSPMPRLLV